MSDICKYDTDNDGNCPRHLGGCAEAIREERQKQRSMCACCGGIGTETTNCRSCGGTGKREDAERRSQSALNAQVDVAELLAAAKAVCAVKSEMDEAPKGKSIEASLNDFFQNHHKRMMAMFCGIDRMKIAVDAMQVSGPKPENNPTER